MWGRIWRPGARLYEIRPKRVEISPPRTYNLLGPGAYYGLGERSFPLEGRGKSRWAERRPRAVASS